MRRYLPFVLIFLIALFFTVLPSFAIDPAYYSYEDTDVVEHPDKDIEGVPEWSLFPAVNKDWYRVYKITDGGYTTGYPFVRFWKNVSTSEREMCPDCDPRFNEVATKDEIWLRDDATREDMIGMMIMYYQLRRNDWNYTRMHSSALKGERSLFFDRWKSDDIRIEQVRNPPPLGEIYGSGE